MVLALLREIRNARTFLCPSDYRTWLRGLIVRFPAVLLKKSLGPVDDYLGESFTLKVDGRLILLQGASFGVAREIFGNHAYVHAEELKNCKTIVDLGANVGLFSLFALFNAPQAKVYAIEAQPELSKIWTWNITSADCTKRAFLRTALVGEPFSRWTNDFVIRHPEVPNLDLQCFFEQFETVDFLKCDIEGAEFQIFTAKKTEWLRKIRRLSLEYHGTKDQGENLAEILRENDFMVSRKDHATLGYLDARRKDNSEGRL